METPLCSERTSCRLGVGGVEAVKVQNVGCSWLKPQSDQKERCLERTPAPARKGNRLQEVSSRDGNGVSQTLKDFYLSHSQSRLFALRAELLAGVKATSLRWWPAGSSQRGEGPSAPGKSSGGRTGRRALAGSRAVETNPPPTPPPQKRSQYPDI